MEIKYKVFYHAKVISEDLRTIDNTDKGRIKRSIEIKLMTDPATFGKPLRRSLKGYRKLRVGDYRVVFKVAKGNVYILTIKHRSVVYGEVLKRL